MGGAAKWLMMQESRLLWYALSVSRETMTQRRTKRMILTGLNSRSIAGSAASTLFTKSPNNLGGSNMAEKEKKVVETENKPRKPEKEKKKGRLKEAWRGFKSDTKKIVWPSWKQVLKNTLIVLALVVICVVIIGALDIAFSEGIGALAKLFS
jgi:preprotein translocase subunit SecE